MSSDPILAIAGLGKQFNIHALGRVIPALTDVDLEVGLGEHLALTGQSGSGKSSLLRCVNRTYLATSGSIFYRPETGEALDMVTLPDAVAADLRQHDIGYVSQFLRSEPRRTALEIVAGAARRRGMTTAAAEVAASAALSDVGVPERLWDGNPVYMSGGEQQRVNLAAATAVPPRLLLLDEPIASLDEANRRRALDRIERLSETGVSIVSVFHDWESIERLSDRVVVLEAGKVVAVGAPHEVRPASRGAA